MIGLLSLVGVGAGFVQRVSGFGLGIFAMIFLPYLMPNYVDAVTVSCLFSCGISTYNAIKYRKQIPLKIIFPLACAAMISIPVAVYFSVWVSEEIFSVFMGVVLICLSIYFVFFDNRIRIKPTLANSVLAGAMGGTLNGLFSTGGPPIVLYLSHAVSDNIKYFAGIQFYFAVTNIYATAFRFANGVITLKLLQYAGIGFLGCVLGDIIGRKVFERLNSRKLRLIIYLGMVISGIIMIF